MNDRFRPILESCQPYLVASPLGPAAEPREAVEIAPEMRFDPHRMKSGPFLNILQRLDELTFGALGLKMPRWVFYDCAEVPGGVFGFARPAREVPDFGRRALDLPDDYTGPVPLSMYVAIPMLEPGAWHTYTLCSLNQVAPGSCPAGIELLTKATALRVLGIERAYGVCQWRSPKLQVHARFGPLEVVTAWTPAHSNPATLTFRFPVSDARIDQALSAALPAPDAANTILLDCDDRGALRALQAEVEAGSQVRVVGPPVVDGAYTRVPIEKRPAP